MILDSVALMTLFDLVIIAMSVVAVVTLYRYRRPVAELGLSHSVLLIMTGVLVLVYGVLFLTLRSADYAFLVGSTLAFVALALTMWLTRNEDWRGPDWTGEGGWFRKKRTPPVSDPV